MPTGELRELVAFDRRGRNSKDDRGNEITAEFAEQFREYARIQPMKGIGSEAVLADRLGGQQPFVIRVHSNVRTRQVDSFWRVRDIRKGTIFDIRSQVNMDERGKYLDFLVQAGVAHG